MSARLFSQALALDMPSPAAKLIIVKMVDCCDDEGRRIFPSVALLAQAGMCSERQVQRYLRKFCLIGLLRVVKEGGTGRKATTHYELDLGTFGALTRPGAWAGLEARAGNDLAADDEAVPGDDGVAERPTSYANSKGDTMSPLALRVTSEAVKGDIIVSPEPLREPSESERESAGADGREREPRGLAENAGVAEGNREEPVATLEAFKAAWGERVALDDRIRLENEWAALPFAERRRAIAAVPDFLRLVAASKRACLPAASTFLRDRRWQDMAVTAHGAAAARPAMIEARPLTRDWWAMLHARLAARDVRRLSYMLSEAERGKAAYCPANEMPDSTGLKAVRATHPAYDALRDRLRALWPGLASLLPRAREDLWVFLPLGETDDAGGEHGAG